MSCRCFCSALALILKNGLEHHEKGNDKAKNASREGQYPKKWKVRHFQNELFFSKKSLRSSLNQLFNDLKLGQVCKNFEKVAADEELWKVLFNQDFSNLTPNESKSFKEQYKLRFMIERNWDKDRSILKTLRIEDGWGSERFYIFQDLIVCPGVNDSFNVYDKNTLKKLYYSRVIVG
jgi:hypothetical protein